MTEGPKGYTANPVAGPGRSGVVFGTQWRGDSIWVIPSDAVSLVASGKLDKRLFEVTALAKNGYGDNQRSTIPLIVQRKGKSVLGKPGGATVGRELGSADSTVVQESKKSAVTFWKWLTGTAKTVPGKKIVVGGALAANVQRVWLDGQVKASLDRSVPQVAAPAAWKKGYTGKGVKVAVLDTGINGEHLDLKGAVVAATDFSGSGNLADHHGHGTHVASTIAGDGARSGGKYKGVAPDALLLNGKVLNDSGSGSESGIIAGMEWAIEHNAKVVNLSLGSWQNDGTAPVDLALNRLSLSSGALFVVAAGNGGPTRYTVSSPSTATEALSVAATNRNQTTAEFSSAGPRLGDFAVKPEIAAPGVGIVAAQSAGARAGDPVGDHYSRMSGTSMATPHVAGAAAILAQQQPTWNARVLKAALMGTAKLPVNESVFRQGAGFLDVSRAVTQKVFALERGVSANLPWPSAGTTTRSITYRNPSASSLTLNLEFKPNDQNGKAAAAGVFSLPSTVTIPARTTARVTLTVDPAKSKPGLLYHGRVNATATGIVVRTPVSVNVQPEMYDVTLDITDRNGNKVSDFDQGQLVEVPYLIGLTKEFTAFPPAVKNGRLVARVPRGAYTIALHVLTPSSDGPPSTTLMSAPRLAVTAPMTVSLDARNGKRATVQVETASAKTYVVGTALQQEVVSVAWGTAVQVADTNSEPEAYVVASPRVDRPFQFSLFQGLSAPGKTYELAKDEVGSLPENPTYPVADSELADLSIVIGAQNVKAAGNYYHEASLGSDLMAVGFGSLSPVTMPSTRRHLVSASAFGTPIRWNSLLAAYTSPGEFTYSEWGGQAQYEAGKQYKHTMTSAAFTPQGSGVFFDYGLMALSFGPFNSADAGEIYSPVHQGNIVLMTGGAVIAESDRPTGIYVDWLTGTQTYTAIMHGSRQVAWSGYVPKVSGTWTFKGTVPSSGMADLPIISTAVTGDFDKWGRAPAGKAFPLTLNITGAAGDVATATTRVSYDDGRTWTTVPVSKATGKWVATVAHPDVTSAYVSLRVIVTDTQGNSGGWTATRSYKIAQLG